MDPSFSSQLGRRQAGASHLAARLSASGELDGNHSFLTALLPSEAFALLSARRDAWFLELADGVALQYGPFIAVTAYIFVNSIPIVVCREATAGR